MAISYRIDGKILQIVDRDSTPIDDVLRTLQRAFTDPHFLPGTCIVVDIREQTAWRNFKDLIQIAHFIGKHRGRMGSGSAIVVSDAVQNTLAQNFVLQAEMSGLVFNVFTDFDEALHWVKEQCR